MVIMDKTNKETQDLIDKLEAFKEKQYLTWKDIYVEIGISKPTMTNARKGNMSERTGKLLKGYLEDNREINRHTHKTCSVCGKNLKRREFNNSSRSYDGKVSYCKQCHKYNMRNWRNNNQERQKNYNREWNIANRTSVQARKAKYQAEKHKVISTMTEEDWNNIKKKHNNTCLYCGKYEGCEITVEHVIPFTRGGSNVKENVITACSVCNSSKGNTDLDEWYPEQEFYSEETHRMIKKQLEEL